MFNCSWIFIHVCVFAQRWYRKWLLLLYCVPPPKRCTVYHHLLLLLAGAVDTAFCCLSSHKCSLSAHCCQPCWNRTFSFSFNGCFNRGILIIFSFWLRSSPSYSSLFWVTFLVVLKLSAYYLAIIVQLSLVCDFQTNHGWCLHSQLTQKYYRKDKTNLKLT